MNGLLVSRPPCSGFGEAELRIVEASNPVEFKHLDDLTPLELKDNKELQEMKNYNRLSYLARYGGLPGLVKGVSSYGNGMKVFSPDLKHWTKLCSSRVVDNKIKFNYGSEQKLYRRDDCWEYAVKRHRTDVIVERRRANAEVLPFELLRPEDTKCPICLEDLSGNVLNCPNNHQLCLPCFALLPRPGGACKCPTCRSPYSITTYERQRVMEGIITDSSGVLAFDLGGGNSFRAYEANEALMLGILRHSSISYYLDEDDRMLVSAFFNWYATHHERFSTYNFNMLTQKDGAGGLQWSLSANIEHNNAFTDFIEDIHAPAIWEDVALTNHSIYRYNDETFNDDLEVIEGANSWARSKAYPGNKKEFLKREIYFRTFTRVNDRDQLIKRFEKIIEKIIKSSESGNNGLLNRVIIPRP